jgi:hypothetical protein
MSNREKLPKWAREEMERLERERDLAAAFVRTPHVGPDVAIPEVFGKSVRGFTFNSHSLRVMHSISSSTWHGTNYLDRGPCKETTTQCGTPQYSTKVLAARAMRCAVENECADRLRAVDQLIRTFESEEQTAERPYTQAKKAGE